MRGVGPESGWEEVGGCFGCGVCAAYGYTTDAAAGAGEDGHGAGELDQVCGCEAVAEGFVGSEFLFQGRVVVEEAIIVGAGDFGGGEEEGTVCASACGGVEGEFGGEGGGVVKGVADCGAG